jgi:hypothetical protein
MESYAASTSKHLQTFRTIAMSSSSRSSNPHFLGCLLLYTANLNTVELQLSGRWLSVSPIIRVDLIPQVNLLIIPQNYLALKLLVIRPSTVQVGRGRKFQT